MDHECAQRAVGQTSEKHPRLDARSSDILLKDLAHLIERLSAVQGSVDAQFARLTGNEPSTEEKVSDAIAKSGFIPSAELLLRRAQTLVTNIDEQLSNISQII